MAAINWENPVNGDWEVAADWSTGTLPGSGDDVTISAPGPYIVTVGTSITISGFPLHLIVFPEANSLTFNAPEAALQENTGKLTVAGDLDVESGFASLNEANSIGGVGVTGGTLAFGNGGALGTGTVTMSGGELLATANETLSNPLNLSGTLTIAAAQGKTLIENASSISGQGSTLVFGSLGEDGVVVWDASVAPGVSVAGVFVDAGTLKVGNSGLNNLLNLTGAPVFVDAGATLDLGGNPMTFPLQGEGAVIDSGAATTLTLAGANFSGSISGPLSLVAGGTDVLSGANTYTGATTIKPGGTLQLAMAARPARSTAPLATAACFPSTKTTP
jgi:fibronectin-binding autotransporter adhesin